jgi:hypothetical protein
MNCIAKEKNKKDFFARVYKKRKQQKLLTNPVASLNKTEVLFILILSRSP